VSDKFYPSPMEIERRTVPRERADINATVVFDDGQTRVSARIADQSAAGLGVHLAQAAPVSCECYILFEPHRIEPVRLAWQASRWLGVVFRPLP
jgi:hypothetical protein